MKIVTIQNRVGNPVSCRTGNCFGWKFNLNEENIPHCLSCTARYNLEPGESLASFPRPGSEFWDRMNELERYSFLKSPDGQSIVKTPMTTGKWIEGDKASELAAEADAIIGELLGVVRNGNFDLSQLSESVLTIIRNKG